MCDFFLIFHMVASQIFWEADLRWRLQCRNILSFKGNALGITTCGREGAEQDLTKWEAGLGWSCRVVPSWGEETKPLHLLSLYHSVSVCAALRKGAWPWARQIFPDKAIPEKGLTAESCLPVHAQASGGINTSFQKGIWLAQFCTAPTTNIYSLIFWLTFGCWHLICIRHFPMDLNFFFLLSLSDCRVFN